MAWLAHLQKKEDDALRQMRAAADLESSIEKHPVTPGAVMPAHELLSEMLLDLGKPDESLGETVHALHDAPNRYNGLWLAAQAAHRANKTEEAKSYRARMMQLRKGATVTITTMSSR